MAFIRNRKDAEEPQTANPAGFEALYQSFLRFVDNMSSASRRTWCILSLIIATVLMVLASLPLPMDSWVFVLIGFPAGIIVFANCVAIGHFTKVRESQLFTYKERVPQSRRLRTVIIFGVILIAILVIVGRFIPFGLGGVIVITAALLAYNTLRRTPEEVELARRGLPDPREYVEDDPDDYEEEVEEDDITPEDDTPKFPNLRRPGT